MTSSREEEERPFHAFERRGWRRVVSVYDQSFSHLTSQTIGPLLDTAGVRPGAYVLDVATGPGYVAGEGAARGARVVGLDFSDTMLAEARGRYPGVEFREGDAQALPFGEATFDAVVMNFGVPHLEDPERAIREAFRVLKPEGRFAFTAWEEPSAAIGFKIVLDAIEMWGRTDVPLPPGPPFFKYADPEASRNALLAAGFERPERVVLPLVWRVPSAEGLIQAMEGGTVRTGGLLGAQTPEDLEAIRRAVRAEAGNHERDGALELPMPAVLSSGIKPADREPGV